MHRIRCIAVGGFKINNGPSTKDKGPMSQENNLETRDEASLPQPTPGREDRNMHRADKTSNEVPRKQRQTMRHETHRGVGSKPMPRWQHD
jgi:hypothetical protein